MVLHKKTSRELTGRELGRSAGFFLSNLLQVCVCVWAAHRPFSSWRDTGLQFDQRDFVEELVKEQLMVNRYPGLCTSQLSSVVVQYKIAQDTIGVCSPLFFCVPTHMLVLSLWPHRGNRKETLPALLSPKGLVQPCQEGCVYWWMQMAL